MATPDHVKQGYSAVAPNKGRRIHAVSLDGPNRTMCGRVFKGWKVSLLKLNCHSCKLEILKARIRAKDPS